MATLASDNRNQQTNKPKLCVLWQHFSTPGPWRCSVQGHLRNQQPRTARYRPQYHLDGSYKTHEQHEWSKIRIGDARIGTRMVAKRPEAQMRVCRFFVPSQKKNSPPGGLRKTRKRDIARPEGVFVFRLNGYISHGPWRIPLPTFWRSGKKSLLARPPQK